ncbi:MULTISPECIES: S41 family peptidase [Pontibacillus]|uniref:S41 family peptidase n=1 Tax=Pontibacillus chungwhensis TaxID=265426 RepID=A0ABY8UYJ6_9BACI|nr:MULTISPECIES: S41 family peptidase [Pontibacillus]MCD5323350.1 S41 family peptidase [Pontibacillus sp. HN14]WIF96731.1 S41 family peptidase [Pontibacillus chungwhensis]
MEFLHIFNEIVDIAHRDYAGWKDKQGFDDPEPFRKVLQKSNLSKEEFGELVQDYLLAFNDHHFYFTAEGESAWDRGFRVRRYEDRLYVTEVKEDDRLQVGQAIISVNRIPIPELVQSHSLELREKGAERERWKRLLEKYRTIEVEDKQGAIYSIEMKRHKKRPYQPTHSLEVLNEETLLMKLTDFITPEPINDLIQENESLLNTYPNLILDLRNNGGGSDSAFYRLAPYLFPEGRTAITPEEGDYMWYNCTHENAERVFKEYKDFRQQTDDPQWLEVLSLVESEWKKHKGEGFVRFDLSALEETFVIEGFVNPKQIVLLTDISTISSAESIVDVAKHSEIITTMGRSTLGVNDYANLITASWGDQFHLSIPTTKLSRVDQGIGMNGVGIEPDIHIPWSPAHLERDVDVEEALSYFKSMKENERR